MNLDGKQAFMLAHGIGRATEGGYIVSSSLQSLVLDNCKLKNYIESLGML
jgi:hypothetical protein